MVDHRLKNFDDWYVKWIEGVTNPIREMSYVDVKRSLDKYADQISDYAYRLCNDNLFACSCQESSNLEELDRNLLLYACEYLYLRNKNRKKVERLYPELLTFWKQSEGDIHEFNELLPTDEASKIFHEHQFYDIIYFALQSGDLIDCPHPYNTDYPEELAAIHFAMETLYNAY